MTRLLGLLLAVLALAATLPAQFADEADFNAKQADRLHDYAEKAFKRGFPRQAKRVWLMVLKEYDPDHAEAHEALGHVKVGKSWNPRSDFKYPTDDEPDPRTANSLKKDWVSLAKTLGNEHRKLAKDYQKAGRDDRARYHFERVIRYLPSDSSAQEALDHKPVEGLSGTNLEATLYERSKLIEGAIEAQFKISYPAEELPASESSAILDAAQIPHRSVRSDHFLFRGDFEVEILKNAAEHGERAIRVVSQVFEGFPEYRTDVANWPQTEVLYVNSQESFQQVLDANTDKFVGTQEDYNFTRKESASATLRDGDKFVAVVNSSGEIVMYDSAVRRVAQTAAGFQSTALREGIGHTFVGMCFNNNRLFAIDRQRQIKTSTEDEIAYNSPNFDEWKDLALESAWRKTGTAAAELPLFVAAKFPNEARIKAWSFCDYLVRRDPSLLQDLDKTGPAAGLNNPIDIEEKFTEQHDGLSIAQLEKEWRDFWTEASPVLKAIRNNTPPLDAVSKDVQKWLEEFNAQRRKFNSPQVNWSTAYSSRCAEHAEYLKTHKIRDMDDAQKQDTDLEGGTHLGNMFAHMALVSVNAKQPEKTMEEWIHWPGYRDALLNGWLWTIGMYAERGIVVIDAIRGVRVGQSREEGKGGITCYPRSHNHVIPNEVDVKDLTPEVRKFLADNGHGDKKTIGYPISYHTFQASLPGARNSYRCHLMSGGQAVEGLLHLGAAGGNDRRSSAPGMIVFYPLEPLPRGRDFSVAWTYTLDGEVKRLDGQFKTR